MVRRPFLIAVFLTLFCLARLASADPILTIGNGAGLLGTDVQILATAGGLGASTAYGFDLKFDTSKLSLVSVANGTATTTWDPVSSAMTGGKLRVWAQAGTKGTVISGSNQQLCAITFHIRSGNAGTTVSLTPANPIKALANASLNPGVLTISIPTPLSLKIGSAAGPVGADVVVAAMANGMKPNTAWGFDMAYDKSMLSLVTVAKGGATANWDTVDASVSGNMIHVWANAGLNSKGAPISGDNLQLCIFRFHVRGGIANTTSSLAPKTAAGGLYHCSAYPGVFTVTWPPPETFRIGSASGKVGDLVIVGASAGNMPSNTSWGFDLPYDYSRLDFVSVGKGTATTTWTQVTGAIVKKGKLRVWANSGIGGGAISGNRQLCTLAFRVRPGTVGTTVTLNPANLIKGLQGSTVTSGSIAITGRTPLSLTIGSATAAAGGLIRIPATASGLTSATSMVFDLIFDKNMLSLAGITSGTGTIRWTVSAANVKAGRIRIWGTAPRGVAANGNNQQLCNIIFRVLNETAGTTTTLQPYYPGGGLTGAALTSGVFTLAPPPVVTPTLAISSVSGASGADVTVTATGSSTRNMTSFGFDLPYDDRLVSWVSVGKVSGAATAKWGTVTGAIVKSGLLRVWANTGPGTPGIIAGPLCSITFHVKTSVVGTTTSLLPTTLVGGLKGGVVTGGVVTVSGTTRHSLVIGNATGALDTTVTVTAIASGLSASTAWGFDLAYNGANLVPLTIVRGKATAKWANVSAKEIAPGKIRVSAYPGTKGPALTGKNLELCKLSFAVVDGEGEIVNLNPSNLQLGLNGAQTTPGMIRISIAP